MTSSDDSQTLLSLNGIGARDGDHWRVKNVSFDLRRGEIVTLIGPNGSGKSTTAKIATGVLKPDAGKIESAEELRIGYVPQKLSIDWTMPLTVERLIQLTGRVKKSEIETALDHVGIAHLRKRDVQSLSGGQFQRALLARAIARKPDLLVLDEPVQGVDFSGELAMYELIAQLRDTLNCGILLISHDLHVVMAQTDLVVCLNGHVCCSGPPELVAASDEYFNLFGPRAQSQLAFYQHEHDHTHLPDGRVQHADGTITEGHEHHHEHGKGGRSDV